MNRRSPWRRALPALLILLLLGLTARAPSVAAQDPEALADPEPLRPANTASPRDTLESFQRDSAIAVEAWRSGDLSAAGSRAWMRAMETMDFSATPYGNARSVQALRFIQLVEVLGRVAIPPRDEIPGAEEVAEGGLTRWTLPETRITIARVQEGVRAGEFLFSAATVERLDRLYRNARDLPYRPGATVGIYNEFRASNETIYARDRELRNRLKVTDTSSPRATLEGFLYSVNQAYALVMGADFKLRRKPPAITRAEAREIEARASSYLERAASTLDLSQVPEALRVNFGLETVLKLKEVLDRMHPPPIETVPDEQMVAAARKGVSGFFARTAGPLRWRLPHSRIEIVEILEGENQGRFLFSADTLQRISDYYDNVRDLPYRLARYKGIEQDYASPEVSPDFYNFYVTTPGYLIPGADVVSAWIDALPDWLKALHGRQTLWQWIALLLCLPGVAVAAYLAFRLAKGYAARRGPPLNCWIMVPVPLLVAVIVLWVREFINRVLNVTGDALATVVTFTELVVFAMLAWAVWNLFKAVTETIIATPWISEGTVDASLLRILARLLGTVAGVWIVLDGLQGLGADIVPLLAGLGVGGLAVALAVRPTLENLIGGLILYFDKPVRVGDFCSFGGQTGTVETIGLRSTQIRALDRTLISVPNAKFADMEIINWARCDRMLIGSKIGLRYETDPDQLRYALVKMREMFHAHPKIDRDTVRVRFAGYGDSSVDIEIRVYALTREWNEYFAIREDVLLRLSDIVRDAGSSFAFPSQTLYMGRDGGLDQELGREVVEEVKSWRRSGRFPFPRLAPERMDALEGTLDYPPRGSPERLSGDAQETDSAEPFSAEPLAAEPLSAKPEPLEEDEEEEAREDEEETPRKKQTATPEPE